MKLLYLNSVITVPSEKGEKRIAQAKKGGVKTDENGKNADWYEDMGLKIPEHLLQNDDVDQDGMIFLKDDEFEFDFVDCIVRLDDFSTCIDNQEIGSIIYLKDGSDIWVEETCEEIFYYITLITRSKLQIFKDNVSHFWRNNYIVRKLKTIK